MRSSQEVCRLTAVTQLCTLCLWMHRQPLTMTHCTCGGVLTPSRSESHENRKKKRAPASARVYCLRYSGWRQALKKQELKNTLFWWGGCSCGFVIDITIRGPDRSAERGGEGRREEKGMLFHTVHKEREHGEKEMWALGSVSVCPFFPSFTNFLVLPLHRVDSWLRPSERSSSCQGWVNNIKPVVTVN